MAAGTIPKPGSKLGPCSATVGRGIELNCGHVDCQASRATAASICTICNTAIGYETRYYNQRDDQFELHGFNHARCVEIRAEKERSR